MSQPGSRGKYYFQCSRRASLHSLLLPGLGSRCATERTKAVLHLAKTRRWLKGIVRHGVAFSVHVRVCILCPISVPFSWFFPLPVSLVSLLQQNLGSRPNPIYSVQQPGCRSIFGAPPLALLTTRCNARPSVSLSACSRDLNNGPKQQGAKLLPQKTNNRLGPAAST